MILSDNGKRSIYDYMSRDPAKFTFGKPQGTHTSHSGAQNNNSNAHHQPQPLFWTFCPFCKANYEFYRDQVNKRIKCPECSKLFIAIDIGKSTKAPHAGKQNVNPRTNPSFSHPAYQCAKTGDAKVDTQRAEPSFSSSECQPPQCTKTGDAEVGGTVENGDIKTKGGENKGTGGNPSDASDSNGKRTECSKQSRKRARVSNSEETVADFSTEKRYRLRKKSSDVKDKQNEPKEVPADAELKEENNKSDSDSEDELEPVYVDVPDLEFSNFDEDKEEHCFAVDQIWAVYDTIDCMPRFYAQIRKVYSSGFRLRITWLEADPEDPLEKKWAEAGLPVTCGKFKHGDSEETKDRLMFSHQMVFEKGSKRSTFVIYPKKGEIWALFKDWDIAKWSSDPGNHMKYKFEIVEILSDFDKDNGVLVAYMVKVEGFVSLFQKTSRVKLAEYRVPSSDLYRFSHRVPSLKLTGNERADVPVGSWELDTASLPDDLDQFYFSINVKVKLESVSSGQMGASFPQPPEKKVRSKHDLDQSTGVQNTSNIIAMPAKGNNPSRQDDDVTECTKTHPVSSSSDDKEPKISIHDFNLDKQNWIFKTGQIWALGRSKNVNLRGYAQIKKIESSPLRLHVDLLESCDDTAGPYGCGIYKASTGERHIIQQDLFLYLVKAQLNGRNYFNIYPSKNEIWVLCKEWDAEYTFADVDAGNYDIVEVIENNGEIIKVLLLTHVGGYKSVFKGVDRVVDIPIDESHRFFYQVSAVVLTDEQDGQLRGFWELDLAEFPGTKS
ncbi:hypothetical protein M8C21_004524 [Ambrosia artemisiifolia]|uniref:DUF3444 domain-containing protein n=1 Tax=Ambrosia artemisiifolia TaxID=4212 RepID=A0AAD5BPH5_AMBAR|nr:hypothetical protein M8C21_004524 [Ambrosia artemisiifolia]